MRPRGDRTENVQSSQPSIKLHGYRTTPVQLRKVAGGDRTVAMLSSCILILGIHVPNLYNFSILIEMTPKTKGGNFEE